MRILKQSSTAQPLMFLMVDSTDHVTGKTGLSPTVTLSKNGGAFASPSGAVTEVANGWYKVAGNATDTNTLGPLILHATGTAADPVDIVFDVVAVDPQSATAFITGVNSLAPPSNWNLHSINASGHVTLADASLVTAKLGTFALAKTTNITGFNDLSAAQVNTEADAALSDIGATSARFGYLDNLNIGGNVASSAEATAIQNNTRVVRVVPEAIELPATTRAYRVEVLLYDTSGNMEAPDSAPTIALVNQAGTDRSSRLDSTTMTLVSTGRYRAEYTSTAGDTKEQLVWAFTIIEGGNTRIYGNTSYITDAAATDFTSADRTKLEAIHTKLPSATYLVGTGNSDGSLSNLDAAITSRLAPTTAGRTLDVSATGEAGIDWANIGSPTTTVNLAGTTITAVENPVDIGSINGSTNASLYLEAMATDYGADSKLSVHVISVATGAIDAAAMSADAGTELAAAVLTAATSTPIHADLRTWIGTAPLALVSQRVQADANVTLDEEDVDAIADQINTTGNGDIPVNHNYGGTDELRILETDTEDPIDDATITALVEGAKVAQTRTGSDGRWVADLMLDAGTYTINVSKANVIEAYSFTLVVVEA